MDTALAYPKKRNYWTTEKKKSLVGYAYIAPFYLLFLIFGLFPTISGFFISFFRWDGLSAMRFLGIENYVNLLKDPLFHKALVNTLFIGVVSHIPILGGGLALAYILNSKLVAFKNIFKTIYFMPMVTSSIAIGIIFQSLFGFNYGFINFFVRLLGEKNINWLGGNGSLIKTAVIVMFAWKWIGWNMVIYLAGMQGINDDIYEAATIDGANHVSIFVKITVPLLKPIILFTLIQSCIGMFNLFTEPFILTNSSWTGGNNYGGLTLMIYLLSKAPQGGNLYGYASACAYIITIMVIIFSVIMTKTFEEREK
ncbi:cytochrome c biogenesis protein [Spirochaetia bacterium]|nr:cytochrome c biogenesis protein [Spirochaetia bacterium]